MAEDKQVRKYFENLSYGKKSLSSEIHGKANQESINKSVASAVRMFDKHTAEGDKDMAAHFKGQIEKWSRQLDNLKAIKEEFAMNSGGGKGGMGMYSNYTDLSFDRDFFTEKGKIMIDENLDFTLGVVGGDGKPKIKKIEDLTEGWVLKGTEESDFMRLQQSAVKQSNSMEEPLDFDIDWEVSKILSKSDAWKVMASDKIGGRYFLNDYVVDNQQDIQSGNIPDDALHPDSFDPSYDNRLHEYYTGRIKKAFDPNHQTPAEQRAADELIAKSNSQNNTENNQA
jgi:hypothetical protein|tara:strand:- start:1924 stop:2772 length:849 start_codon:yes stop_codon:yes gene_type:complete